jgi:hypothetical protein
MHRRTTKSPGGRWLSSMMVVSTIVAATTMGGIVVAAGPTTAAGADPIGDCTTTAGVIVAVDFSPWGYNDVVRGCDATLTTGYAALQAAGFITAGDEHDGPAFICRINGFPTVAQDPCINTPPATAYWSYWHADAGQNTWTYSTEGAMTYQPPAGSVDAWVYGSTALGGTDGEPTFSPSSVRATNTSVIPTSPGPSPTTGGTSPSPAGSFTPSPSSSPPEKSTTTAPKGGSAAVVPASHPDGSTSTSPGSTADATPVTPTTAAFQWPTTTTTTTIDWGALSAAASGHHGSGLKIVDAAPAASDHVSSGSPAPLIEGVLVVVVLTAVAYLVAWRRRRAG